MNEQLPPVDPALRDQLARRSAGRRPAGLLDEVLSTVDSAPASAGLSAPVVGLAAFRRNPRVSGALVGLAAVVVLVAALVAVPALRSGPAAPTGPTVVTNRALTATELAAVLAGPELAVNTALVADVTIKSNHDVCPMNRYPTLGVIEGIPSQVCVMTSGVTYNLQSTEDQTGVFAFRYLGRGVLGLLGKLTTPSSGLAYKVAETWPLQAQTFVVDGWLGNETPDGVAMSCAEVAPAGDVLAPYGSASCPKSQDWLSDGAAPNAIASPAASILADKNLDQLALYGNARLVRAYGARQIDGLDLQSDPSKSIHGRFVVKSQTGACPGEPVTSSVGCGYWLVLARLADITVPGPSSSPSTAAVSSDYPAKRALTTAELGRLLDDGTLNVNDVVVADITLLTGDGCPLVDSATPMNLAGKVDGVAPAVCVYTGTNAFEPGHAVLRMTGSRTFFYLGTVPEAAAGRLTYASAEAWPNSGTILVSGSLRTASVVGNDPAMCPGATPGTDGSIGCAQYLVNDQPVMPASTTPIPAGQGVFLLTYDATSSSWRIQARLTDLASAGPATPVPEITQPPSPQTPVAISTPHPGYPFDRALTTAELAARLADKSLKPGTTFLANVTIADDNTCQPTDGSGLVMGVLQGTESRVCVLNVALNQGKVGGTFALRYFEPGVVANLGQIEPASATQLVREPSNWPMVMNGSKTIVVAGRLLQSGSNAAIVSADSTSSNLAAGQSVQVDRSAALSEQPPTEVAVFVVRADWVAVPATSTQPAPGDGVVLHVVGKIDDPADTAPTPTPTAAAQGSSLGLWGSGNRPLTLAELGSLWSTGKLAGRTVITKGPVPASAACLTADGLDQCNYAIAGVGYWVIGFDAASKPSVVGQLTTPKSGFMWTAETLNATVLKSGSLAIVDGSLIYDPTCVDPAAQCSTSQIMGTVNMRQSVNEGAYQIFSGGSTAGDDIAGPFLIQLGEPSTVLSRLEPATP